MKTETEINYMLVDPTAAADGAPEVTTKQPWVNLDQIHDGDDAKIMRRYGTLETDEFRLDGGFILFPDNPEREDMGLWSSQMSDGNGWFASPPVLTVAFSRPHTSLGVTLLFSVPTDDWADRINVKWYDAAGAVLADLDFLPDSAAYFCDRLVQNYYKVRIVFYKTNKPHRWLKLFRLYYGVVEHLRGDRITQAQIVEEADPISATVSVNTLHFGFYADRRFDLLDLTGVYAVFQQQQRVRVRQRVDGVLREMGLFYTDVPSVENERVVSMDCIDLVGVLEQTEYMGGLWADGISAAALLRDVMRSADAADDYQLDETLQDVTVTGYLPICTHREALQQLAFAIGAVVSCARGDKIRLYPLPVVASSVITPHDKAAGHTQTQREYVSGVEVYVHDYALAGSAAEVYQADCRTGRQVVRFGGAITDLSCTGAEIVKSGVNYVELNVKTAGKVTITGKRFEDQVTLGGSMYAEVKPAAARANVKVIENCTLSADPQALARRVYEYYQRRIVDEGDLFPVDAAAGQAASVQTAAGRTLTGLVESMDIDLTGGGIARTVIAG